MKNGLDSCELSKPPTSLQFMNVNKLVFTDDHGEIIFEIKCSKNVLEEFFKEFDRLVVGSVIFRRDGGKQFRYICVVEGCQFDSTDPAMAEAHTQSFNGMSHRTFHVTSYIPNYHRECLDGSAP